jgi:hypothetical protein
MTSHFHWSLIRMQSSMTWAFFILHHLTTLKRHVKTPIIQVLFYDYGTTTWGLMTHDLILPHLSSHIKWPPVRGRSNNGTLINKIKGSIIYRGGCWGRSTRDRSSPKSSQELYEELTRAYASSVQATFLWPSASWSRIFTSRLHCCHKIIIRLPSSRKKQAAQKHPIVDY